MSFLPAGNSLRGFLPDLDDLLENPAEYLGVGPIVVGPRRMYGLASVFAAAGVGMLLSYYYGKHDAERIALGVGLLFGSAIWFGWSLWTRGHSLVLHKEGVEVKYHDLVVWCPWALFNASGEPHVPEVDSPFTGLILPVAADAVPFIELRRGESVAAHGAQVKAPQFVLSGTDEVVLPGRYEVATKDLGDVLLHVGQVLGLHLPRGAPPREAYQAEADEIADPDPAGWITARATRLRFPPNCAACGEGTTEVMRFEAWSRGGLMMRVFMPGVAHEVMIPVPVCAACQTEGRDRQSRGAVRGFLVGALLGPLAVVFGEMLGWAALTGFAALVLATVGALIGLGLGQWFSSRPPVQLRDYSPTRGTLRLRFRNPDYAATVIALLRGRGTAR